MKYRKRVNPRKDKRKFSRTADMSHKLNSKTGVGIDKRGGIRL